MRIHERGVDRLHRRLELGLDHPVELERLARRDAQRAVRVTACNFVELQPLRGRADAARQSGADHEAIRRLELLAPALVADIPVVLLVAAVELDQDGVVVTDRTRQRILQALHQRAAQVAALVA